ncbi:MAG: ATP-binding cassette domain-containing protein [Hymenobacter sp.]
MNLFLDFIKPSGGAAFVNGLPVAQAGSGHQSQYLAYIPENLMLYPDLTGLENLDFFCGLAGKARSRPELLRSAAPKPGLPDGFAGRRVAAYSKGMRQKVGIALAVAKEATVLLLDEPTSGLDPKASNEFSGPAAAALERAGRGHADGHPRPVSGPETRAPTSAS